MTQLCFTLQQAEPMAPACILIKILLKLENKKGSAKVLPVFMLIMAVFSLSTMGTGFLWSVVRRCSSKRPECELVLVLIMPGRSLDNGRRITIRSARTVL